MSDQTTDRNFDTNPYSPDEQRVADWLSKRTKGMAGAGYDPIGFVLASYNLLVPAAAPSHRLI